MPLCMGYTAFSTQQEQTAWIATYWIGSHPGVTYRLNLYVTDGTEHPWRPGGERSHWNLALTLKPKTEVFLFKYSDTFNLQ
ncbi:hypothetical protein CHARACLAT_004904 [Characodon lateralis]|uniref:Uncharacterized protein n=1 Tax=Characodon lateralis TaxID=208331 RepID=A0ABU7CWV1_9TELE|nr:hypothetical protein [Characodon lateralis]